MLGVLPVVHHTSSWRGALDTRTDMNCTLPFTFNNIVTSISVAREQLGKHVPAKKNSWSTIGKGLSIARQRTVNNRARVFYVVRAEPVEEGGLNWRR
jgi:hypothetical protein